MADITEWDAVRRRHHYRCCICRQPEKVTGTLLPVVINEKQGNPCRTLPLCPDHHVKYMQGFFSCTELKKLGMTQEEYRNHLAKRAESPHAGSGLSASEKITQAKEDTIKKIQKAKKMKMPQVHSDYQKVI